MVPTWNIQFWMHLHDTVSKEEKLADKNCASSVGFGFTRCLSVVPTHAGVGLIM